jgi:hypothetical protein
MTDPSREIRVSDTDRQAAADRLRAAQTEGRLSVPEYDDRLGRLYQAVTYGDIANLFTDLPNHQQQQQFPQQQQYMPPPMAQPGMVQPAMATGQIAGPAAIVQNTIVVGNQMGLPNSGVATAGLIFGILGLAGFWIPFGDIVFSALAILLSILGMVQTSSGRYGGRGRAIAGLICGIVGMIPAIIVIALLLSAAAAVH